MEPGQRISEWICLIMEGQTITLAMEGEEEEEEGEGEDIGGEEDMCRL